MRLLCINPNTDAEISRKLGLAVAGFLDPADRLEMENGRFGARYIASRAAYAIAGHAALDAYAARAQDGFDAVLLACFGDPGLAALREIADIPVIGMAEASCLAAARLEGRFAIVTGGANWRPMLMEFVAALGLAERLASVRVSALTGGEIAENPERGIRELRGEISCCAADGAARVILGGAGLAGLAPRLAEVSPVPVIDCVEAMVLAAKSAAAQPASRQRPSLKPVESRGLAEALARLVS